MPHNDFEYEEFMRWKEARARQHTRTDGPDPSHRGVTDQNYVRGSDVREFPKMAYRLKKTEPKGYQSRIVESVEEQEQATKNGWIVKPAEILALLEKLAQEQSGDAEPVAVAAAAR
jgi:hypothetical protein